VLRSTIATCNWPETSESAGRCYSSRGKVKQSQELSGRSGILMKKRWIAWMKKFKNSKAKFKSTRGSSPLVQTQSKDSILKSSNFSRNLMIHRRMNRNFDRIWSKLRITTLNSSGVLELQTHYVMKQMIFWIKCLPNIKIRLEVIVILALTLGQTTTQYSSKDRTWSQSNS